MRTCGKLHFLLHPSAQANNATMSAAPIIMLLALATVTLAFPVPASPSLRHRRSALSPLVPLSKTPEGREADKKQQISQQHLGHSHLHHHRSAHLHPRARTDTRVRAIAERSELLHVYGNAPVEKELFGTRIDDDAVFIAKLLESQKNPPAYAKANPVIVVEEKKFNVV